MADIRPDEISAILREQLSGFSTEAQLEEEGKVLQVGDGIARVYGLTQAQAGELVQFESGLRAVVLNLEEDNVGVVLMGPSEDVKEGDTVKRTGVIASVEVTEGKAWTYRTIHCQTMPGSVSMSDFVRSLVFRSESFGYTCWLDSLV